LTPGSREVARRETVSEETSDPSRFTGSATEKKTNVTNQQSSAWKLKFANLASPIRRHQTLAINDTQQTSIVQQMELDELLDRELQAASTTENTTPDPPQPDKLTGPQIRVLPDLGTRGTLVLCWPMSGTSDVAIATCY